MNVIYTLDGSVPTRFNFEQEIKDMIIIKKSSVLKIRTIGLGYIESDVYELDIKVEEMVENQDFSNNMERPMYNEDTEGSIVNSENFSGIEEDIMQNENFVSWHENNSYATPKD